MQLFTLDLGWNAVAQIRGIDYNRNVPANALTDQQYEQLRTIMDLPPVENRANAEVKQEFVGTTEDANLFIKLGINPTLTRIRGMFIDHNQMPIAHQQVDGEFPKLVGGPTIINLTIPNAALFAVRKLTVLEDCCTNEVQRMLDDGWRIVAVCPPNDTRRPSYILGHTENK